MPDAVAPSPDELFHAPAAEVDSSAPSEAFHAPAADVDTSAEAFHAPAADVETFSAPAADQSADQALGIVDGLSPQGIAKKLGVTGIQQFFNQNQKLITPDRLKKLGDAYEAANNGDSTVSWGTVAKSAGSAVADFGKGGVRLAFSLPSILFGEDPDEVKNSPNPGETPEQAKTRLEEAQNDTEKKAEAMAGLEAGSLDVANTVRMGARKLFNYGFRAATKHELGAPVDAEADILNPGSFSTPVDWSQRLLNDAAVQQQQEQASQGQGAVTKSVGLDADTLAKEGIQVDPDAIRELSSFENPVNLVPFGEGFAVQNAAGKILAKAATQDALKGLVEKLGGAISKTGEVLTTTGEKAKALSSGVTGAIIGSATGHAGAGAAVSAAAPTVLKTVGKAATFAGEKLAESDLPVKALNAGIKTAAGAAQGAAVAAPFALAQDDPQQGANTFAGGAAFGALGSVAGQAKDVAVDKATAAGEKMVASLYQKAANETPVAPTPAYGTDNALDAAHEQTTSELAEKNPTEANNLNLMRAALAPQGGEIYAVPDSTLLSKSGLPQDTPADQIPNGYISGNQIFLRRVGDTLPALYHEPGHFLTSNMDSDVQSKWFSLIKNSMTPEEFKAGMDAYNDWLPEGAPKVTPEGYLHELSAESISAYLRGMSLDGLPSGWRRALVGMGASFLESVGAYKSTTQEGPESGTVTPLGIKVSPTALGFVEPHIRNALSAKDVTPAQPPVIKDFLGTKEVAPISALPEALTDTASHFAHAPEDYGNEPAATPAPSIPGWKTFDEKTGTWVEAAKPGQAPTAVEPKNIPAPTPEPAKPVSEPQVKPDLNKGEKPNLRGITSKNYVPFTGPGRSPDEIGLTTAQAAVNKDETLTPENKKAFQNIAQNVRRPLQVTYRSAETAGDMSRTARRDETKSNGPGNARINEGVGKVGVPIAFKVTSDGTAQVNLFSPDKVLANARDLTSMAHDAKSADLIPYENKNGALTPAGESAFNQDLENYLANQDNGYRGDGKKLVRPENPEGFIPAENPDYKPVSLEPNKSDFINATMALKQSKTNRVQVDKVTQQPITPLNVKAAKIAKLNNREALKPGDVTAKNANKQTYEQFGNQQISEFNPLRKKLDEAGVDTRELTEANEWVNANDILKAEPLTDNRLTAGAPLVTAAGFMPARGESPAVRMPDGKVFSGEDLQEAREKSIMSGKYSLADQDKSIEGTVKGGKFSETDYSKYDAKPSSSSKQFNKIWFTPDGERHGISGSDTHNLNGDYHNNWLRQNQADLEEKFGWPKKGNLKTEMRADALKRGFVRLAFEPNNGRLTIEANQRRFPKATRDSIVEYVRDHAQNISNATVNLFNDKGVVTHNLSRRMVEMTPEEKLENIPLISDENGHVAFMPARQNFRDGVTPRHEEDTARFMPAPNQEVRDNAEGYMKSAGMDHEPHTGYAPVNEPLAKKIADFYQDAKHSPESPEVEKSYKAFVKETRAQWDYLTDKGVKMEPWTREGQPYSSSEEMAKDVRDNNHLWFFPTESGFGEGEQASGNPLLAKTGLTVDKVPLVVNDMFRAVHDYFGHSKEGYQFGPRGEYNAFLSHSKMYSDEARPAMAAETLGQNSWVNFGEHLRNKEGNIPAKGEKGYIPPQDRPFAEQKSTVLPESMVNESLGKSEPERVVQAAVKLDSGKIFTGGAHFHAYDNAEKAGEKLSDSAVDGFVTNTGRFVDRREAYSLAKSANQISDRSFSEAAGSVGFGHEPDFVKNKELESLSFRKSQVLKALDEENGHTAFMPSRKQGELHSEDLNLPSKFWLHKSGQAEDALGDHAKFAAQKLGLKGQIDNDNREQYVSKLMEKGSVRGEQSSGRLFLEGIPQNFSDLSKAQRTRIEDNSLNTGTPTYYNGEHVEGGDSETVRFMPKAPESFSEADVSPHSKSSGLQPVVQRKQKGDAKQSSFAN